MPPSADERSLDGDSVDGNRAKALEHQLSKLDDRFGSNDLTATTASSVVSSVVTNNNSTVDLHDSDGSLYFDDEAEKKKKKPTKKAQPTFNQGGALEMLMSPAAKKKPSAAAAGTMTMLPKAMTPKGKKDPNSNNMSSKVANTLDKLATKVPSKATDDLWDRLGKGSSHGISSGNAHRRSKSNTPVPDLTDEIGFIVEAGSPDALGSSSHKVASSQEIPRTSRRGGRRGPLGSSTHQKEGATQPPPALRRRASRRRLDGGSSHGTPMRSSSHGPGDRPLRSSSHGPGDRAAAGQSSPGTPRTMRRRVGTPTTPGTLEMSQSAHGVNETPGRRRMRRRASGSSALQIDVPFESLTATEKESVNVADFLSPSKQVMRGRRPGGGSGKADELRSSNHGAATRANSGGSRPRRRSRDPALVNAGVN